MDTRVSLKNLLDEQVDEYLKTDNPPLTEDGILIELFHNLFHGVQKQQRSDAIALKNTFAKYSIEDELFQHVFDHVQNSANLKLSLRLLNILCQHKNISDEEIQNSVRARISITTSAPVPSSANALLSRDELRKEAMLLLIKRSFDVARELTAKANEKANKDEKENEFEMGDMKPKRPGKG